jgi:hypothetical protein
VALHHALIVQLEPTVQLQQPHAQRVGAQTQVWLAALHAAPQLTVQLVTKRVGSNVSLVQLAQSQQQSMQLAHAQTALMASMPQQ